MNWKSKFGDSDFTMRQLCEEMPEIVDFETKDNAKEGYQDIQIIFNYAHDRADHMDMSMNSEELSWYLLSLAKTAPLIDEEVFDHRMNLISHYRQVLKKVLPFIDSWDRDAADRVRESIKLACDARILISEKYEDYFKES